MKRRTYFAVAGILLISISLIRAEDLLRFPICTATGNQYSPVIDGATVVWNDIQSGINGKIESYNLLTGRERTLATGVFYDYAISKDNIVWKDETGNYDNQAVTPGIYAFNLNSQTSLPLVTSRGNPSYSTPIISGNKVAWTTGYAGQYGDIQIMDLSSGAVDSLHESSLTLSSASISGNTLICFGTSPPNSYGNIYAYDLTTHSERTIAEWVLVHSTAISDNYVVWPEYNNGYYGIVGYDLAANEKFTICAANGNQYYPQISGNIVVWQDERNGNADIYGYNLNSHKEFEICTLPGDQTIPDISGSFVVWNDNQNGDWNIYGAQIPEPTSILCFAAVAALISRKCQSSN